MIKQPETASFFSVKPIGNLFALTLENDLPEFNLTLAYLTDQDAENLANSIVAALKEKRKQ